MWLSESSAAKSFMARKYQPASQPRLSGSFKEETPTSTQRISGQYSTQWCEKHGPASPYVGWSWYPFHSIELFHLIISRHWSASILLSCLLSKYRIHIGLMWRSTYTFVHYLGLTLQRRLVYYLILTWDSIHCSSCLTSVTIVTGQEAFLSRRLFVFNCRIWSWSSIIGTRLFWSKIVHMNFYILWTRLE